MHPLAWNVLLAARNEGYSGTMTPWRIAQDAEVKTLPEIPPHWALATIMR